jgi:serine/threonine protein kinase
MSEEQKQMNSLESEDTEPTTSDSEHKYRFRTGDQIANRYKVIASLGVGGFAEVYRCQDDRLGRDVAVKVMNEKGSVPTTDIGCKHVAHHSPNI